MGNIIGLREYNLIELILDSFLIGIKIRGTNSFNMNVTHQTITNGNLN